MEAVEKIDAYIKRVLDTIDSRPERDNEEWLIVMTADHAGGWKDGVGNNNFNHGDFTRSDR